MQNTQLENKIKELLLPKTVEIKRKASGFLKYDYLVPGGPYNQLWDWDAYFMGKALSMWIPSEAIYLKNIVKNILKFTDEKGFCPGCLKPDGPSKSLRQIKPFIAQSAYLASTKLGDFTWLKPYYEKLKLLVLYREKNSYHEEIGLCSWWNAMESGADNDIALISTEDNSIISPDLNAFLYLEYECFSRISREIGFIEDSKEFIQKCSKLKENLNKYLWCDEDDTYYCFDIIKKKFVRAVTYTCTVPMYAGIVDNKRAERFIKRYMLNEDKLWSCYGLRTLTKDYKNYNNENIIMPYSNWQGPVWPIANYIYCLGLARYGYKKEALDIAHRVIKLCVDDIEALGGMHENYNAETGEPLAAPNFISWNLLLMNLCDEIREFPNKTKMEI